MKTHNTYENHKRLYNNLFLLYNILINIKKKSKDTELL